MNLKNKFMKKKSIYCLALSLSLFTGYNMYRTCDSDKELSVTMMSNIEALATGDVGSGSKSCYKNITKAQDNDKLSVGVTDCSSCSTVRATSSSNKSSC